MNVHRQIVNLIDSGRPFAVGLILSAEGSTPREAGVKAIIETDGRIHGTLGGGTVEAEAQARAATACESGQVTVFEMDLAGASAGDHEPICGGRMRLLLDPTASKAQAAYGAAAEAAEMRRRGVLLTTVTMADGEPAETAVCWIGEDDFAAVQLPEGFPPAATLADCVAREHVRRFEVSLATEGLIEPVVPAPLLIIAGGGHIGQALALQATLVGCEVVVLDDRPEFTDPTLFPEGAHTRCCDLAAELAAHPLGPDTHVVIVTRGHQHDAEALRACVGRPVSYLGMIGSRRKVGLMRETFVEQGWATEAEFDAVCAPIGLDLGAETVPEIAASIVAQMIAVRRLGTATARPRKPVF